MTARGRPALARHLSEWEVEVDARPSRLYGLPAE